MNAIATRARRRRCFRRPRVHAESAATRGSPPLAPTGGRATDTVREPESLDSVEMNRVAQTPILWHKSDS